jgi:uncharacterized protein
MPSGLPSITAHASADASGTPRTLRQPGERERALDALRGLAILGGLTVNVRAYASIDAARTNPTAWGDLHGVNLWVWIATYVLADGKFVSMFALVFGAGLVARAARAPADPATLTATHYRRMAALAVLGALHAYLVWWGDWLLILSVVGAVVFNYVRASARQLMVAGLILYAVYPLLSVWFTLSLPWSPPEEYEQLRAAWSPSPAAVDAEIAAYRGGWLDQERYRAPRAFAYQTSELALRFLWQVSGLMLLGMGLYKAGLLRAARPARHYALMAAVGLGVGVPVSLYEVHRAFSHGWDLIDHRLVVTPLAYWSSLAITLGWAGLVLLACSLGYRLRSLVAVGRLALSNYLLQTAVCTTVFYGHGLGLFGHLDRASQLAFVVGLGAIQVAVSSLWLRKFEMGPVEWAWRAAAAAFPAPRRA